MDPQQPAQAAQADNSAPSPAPVGNAQPQLAHSTATSDIDASGGGQIVIPSSQQQAPSSAALASTSALSLPFKPPEAFGVIEPRVYRSAIVTEENFAYLRELDLRTLLVLSPETPSRALRAFCETAKIDLVLEKQIYTFILKKEIRNKIV